jgi:hypothetical protein
MATIGINAFTFADWAKRYSTNGKLDMIIEQLAQKNEIVEDMILLEGNLPTGHKTTVRTGLPSGAWRMLNYGVPKGKSSTVQVTDTCGMLETYFEVDKALADLNGNTASFRFGEGRAFLEGLSQQMAQTLMYGNTQTNPERFLGLAPRYNSLSAANAENIVDAGGSGSDNTSIWLVVWGPDTCHGIFPKGSKAGFQHKDLGEVTLEDGAGGQYQGYRDHFKWDMGLSLRDWRFVVRVANIDVSSLSSDMDYLKALIGKLVEAEERVPSLTAGRAAFYGNRTVRTALRKAILEKIANNLTQDTVGGKIVTAFDRIPFRRVDQLLNTEARVV